MVGIHTPACFGPAVNELIVPTLFRLLGRNSYRTKINLQNLNLSKTNCVSITGRIEFDVSRDSESRNSKSDSSPPYPNGVGGTQRRRHRFLSLYVAVGCDRRPARSLSALFRNILLAVNILYNCLFKNFFQLAP